ncbi:MAG TPA: TolC family protein [Chitinophagaceae bacterium]|nr:TolC family protein [Chitinophagaceae bacterium]
MSKIKLAAIVFDYFCRMIKRCMKLSFCLFAVTVLFGKPVWAQTAEKWDLRKCVEYAMENNISVRQADVQARITALTYEQSKLSQYPSANLQNSAGYQFGRSIDPSTNQFTNEKLLGVNHGLNVNLDLFNWFSKKNTIAANRFQAEAYVQGVEKAKNDIALNVANAYLQILLNSEQIKISDVQVKQSVEQVGIIKIQVKEGALPELNLAEMEAQLANDSSTLITAKANYTLSILQLKALLNIDADKPFDVEIPPVEFIPVEPLADLDPAAVYLLAITNLPQQKINELNLQAAIKNVAAVKGRMYPSLSLFGGLDSRYSGAQKLRVKSFAKDFINIGTVTVGGTPYFVSTLEQQTIPTGYSKNTYFRQLSDNFSQSVGLSLNIPIFNGGIARTNWTKAKLDVTNVELQNELDAKTLKQDIYQAHANAVASLQKFNAAGKSVETSQKAYDFAKKRFDVGLLNTIDLITNQNNLFRAKINKVSAQADYVFKMKLLEFYKGQGLKL